MSRLLDIAAKDIKIMVRDRAALLVMLAMPLGLIFILGSALGSIGEGDSLDAPVAIVNKDAGDTGERFVEGLTSAEEIDAVFNISVRDDAEAVRTEVEQGDLTAALIIPEDLSEKVVSGEPVALEVLQDPGSQMSAGIWAGVVRAGVANASAQIIAMQTLQDAFAGAAPSGAPATPPAGSDAPASAQQMPELSFDAVTVREVDVEIEKQISMISYYAAGMSGMFLLFGGMFGAFSFVRERREQTLARMMATPASKVTIVGGKALGVLLIAALQFVVLLGGTMLLFRVDWGTNILGTVIVGFAEAIAAAGLAMTLAALGRSERAIGGIAPAFIMLFAALGGSMIPAEQLPSWLLPAQVLSPVYWTVNSFLDLMRGATLTDVLPNVGAVLAIGLVLFTFGVWRLRYE
ncbi:MAG: ABC transporter permease [Coriobacteriia bacterium]|nr:ABC transporter permease [Coriobacteriia bacterium]